MDPRDLQACRALERRGFARFPGVVSPELVGRLVAAAHRLEQREPAGWADATAWFEGGLWRSAYFAEPGRNSCWFDCLGIDDALDVAVEEVLALPRVRALRDSLLGPDHRLWFAQLRWAEPGADEYFLHQDVFGELGLCIYLSPHPDARGSMVFWPESHLWPRVLQPRALVAPRWVEHGLASVEGEPGDVCVFFNKTWHGRTSAREERRLVMLLSFTPPGPLENARRVPDAVRARLGPELWRVTDPEAGRAFRTTPAAPPFPSTRIELDEPIGPRASEREGDAAEAFRDYAWAWCRSMAEATGAPDPEDAALTRYAEALLDLPGLPVVPRRIVEHLREDLERRSAVAGHGRRGTHALRLAHALAYGEHARADEELAIWRGTPALPGDPLGPPDHDLLARYHADRGDDARTLAAAATALEAALGGTGEPSAAASHALGALARAGRVAEAERVQQRTCARVAWSGAPLSELASHLTFLADRAAAGAGTGPGLRLVAAHVVCLHDAPPTVDVVRFWHAAERLFRAAERAGIARFVPDRTRNEVPRERSTGEWAALCGERHARARAALHRADRAS